MEVLEATIEAGLVPLPRRGPRPRTPLAPPHIQLDQWPPPEIANALLERSLGLAEVRSKQSRMASPQSRALSLPDRYAGGPPEAFIDEHEFCHVHPLPEASIHLTLPNPLRDRVIQLGWAEQHPVARAGIMPETLVMVYAPRDHRELDTAMYLIWSSYQFARGL